MLTLDAALHTAVEEALLDDYSRNDLTAATRYLGWADGEVPEKAIKFYIEIGDRFAQRVRNWLAGKDSKLSGVLKPCVDLIDRAVEIVEEMVPAEEQQIGERLAKEGLVSFPMSAYAVVTAAEDFGLAAPSVALLNRSGVPWIGSALASSIREEIIRVIQKNCRECGMGDWDALPEQIRARNKRGRKQQRAASAPSVTESDLKTGLFFYLDGYIHEDGRQNYYWLPTGKNQLNRIAREVLSVTQTLAFDKLIEAIERRFSFRRQGDRVPPAEMIRAYFKWHPDYVFRGNTISHRERLDFRKELNEVDIAFVSVLRAAPGGVLHRDEFRQACVKDHSMNDNTFSTETSYSVVLERLDRPAGYWTTRGNSPPSKLINQLGKTTGGAERTKRSVSKKLVGGKIELTYELPAELDSSVAYIPSQFKAAREVGRYKVFSGGEPLLKLNSQRSQAVVTVHAERGTVWGFAPFVSQVDAKEGDHLIAEFDPRRKRVDLSLKRQHGHKLVVATPASK